MRLKKLLKHFFLEERTLSKCEGCKYGVKLIPFKSLHTVTSYKQWCSVEVPSHDPTAESYKKIAIVTKDVQVGEVLENFRESFSKTKKHQNVKHIQAEAFLEDIKNPSKRVLQIDYAMAYQCELQNEAIYIVYGLEVVLICLLVLCVEILIRRP